MLKIKRKGGENAHGCILNAHKGLRVQKKKKKILYSIQLLKLYFKLMLLERHKNGMH